jgi:hypothetical protein
MCLSGVDGLDADQLCTAVLARARGQFRVVLFEWQLETNRKTLQAFSGARAAWMENSERRRARAIRDGRAETVDRFFHEVVARRRRGIDYGAMHPLFSEADYLGGDPLHHGTAKAGTLVACDAGLSYRLRDGTELLHLRPRETHAVALWRPDTLRHAVQAGRSAEIGALLGGREGLLWGALVGGTGTSQQSALLVIAERDGARFTAGFALAEISGERLVTQLQVQRFHLGMAALPAPDDVGHQDAQAPDLRRVGDGHPPRPSADHGSPASPAAAVVRAPDPLDQIERLGSLRDRGLITDDEFNAKKRELLDRM